MINEMIVSLINSAQRGIHTNHRYEYQKKSNRNLVVIAIRLIDGR